MKRRLIDFCRLCYKENRRRTDITKVYIQSILVDITSLKALDVSLICSYYPVA